MKHIKHVTTYTIYKLEIGLKLQSNSELKRRRRDAKITAVLAALFWQPIFLLQLLKLFFRQQIFLWLQYITHSET